MNIHVLRLKPGDDLRAELEQVLAAQGAQAACVVSAVGSLSRAVLRYANKPQGTELLEPLELVFLSGTLSADGAHLHASVSNGNGEVRGGHVMPGCIVRTTAEIVVGLLPGWAFRREVDDATGYKELIIERDAP